MMVLLKIILKFFDVLSNTPNFRLFCREHNLCSHFNLKKNKYLIVFMCQFFFAAVSSQNYFDTVSVHNKIKFIRYLKENKQTNDAWFLLNYFNSKQSIDSLQLMEVKLLLDLRREKDAGTLLDKISHNFQDASDLNCTYVLLKNHTNLLTGSYDSIKEPVCKSHFRHKELWRIQLLSASLFRNRLSDFEMIFNSAKSIDTVLSTVEYDLSAQKNEMTRTRKKSGFLAGILSAILPGSGKIYAGKPREALTGFIPVLFNAAQAGEGYYYRKFDSPHLYVFGAIGTVFYASGIYGSARAARRKNEEFHNKIRNNIEFEISKLIQYY